jgi:hypothetical protein
MSIKRLHLTKPLVTHLAGARAEPKDFAGEANVRQPGGLQHPARAGG